MFDASKIPGMIDPLEQKDLFLQASSVNLTTESIMVEFGTFLGRSTACIAEGLYQNPPRSSSNIVYAYDSFRCRDDGAFAPHVVKHLKRYNAIDLLDSSNGFFDFERAFRFFTQKYSDAQILETFKRELIESFPPQYKQIVLMHIDSPKFYDEFRLILLRFFPKLQPG